ncbi:hypothetical protein CUR95_09085 [Bordetella bronchiseptica]|nr:hypothetical protein [Bordetella bronchiseptica]
MALNSQAIGKSLRVTQEIDARWVLAYSAALNLTGPEYLDDSRPGGVVVPPTFCVCLEWAIAGSEARNALLGLSAAERAMAIHAAQDSHFISPIKLGMRVETTGEPVHMFRCSIGSGVVMRYDTRDARTDELLVRSWSTHLFRGVEAGFDSVGDMPPEVPAAPAISPITETIRIAPGLAHIYSECARIWNPIHTEQRVARAANLPSIILHGTATWALAGKRIVETMAPQGHMGHLRRLAGSFRKPVFPAQEAALLRHVRPDGKAVSFTLLNGSGDVALASGLAMLG